MKNSFLRITSILLSILTLNACKGNGPIDPEPITPNAKGIQIAEVGIYGKILTDADGKTLYYFSNDVDGMSACTDGCLTNWPIYFSADASTDSKIDKSEIGQITRADGAKQSTYKGWPLYYFKGDTKAKEIKGDKVENVWYVAKPDYTVMVANAQLVGADGKSYIQTGEGIGKTLYLTDDKGRTLYAFKNDNINKNNFTKEDFSNDGSWPIFQQEAVALPSYVDKALVSKIMVFGKTQLTYKGWPLYYFGADTKRGETKGVSQPSFGIWPIVNATTAVATELTPKGIQLAEHATHGKILTDASGRSLYYFSDDVDGKSACTDGCLANWPVYFSADATTDSKVDKSEIGEITRSDGSKQSTYKGWPLYYYVGDVTKGETKGDKVGNIWYIAKPDYTVMVSRAQLIGADGKHYIQTGEGTGKTIYLTDDRGRTLYAFKNDNANKNNYTASDFSNDGNWPIFQKEAVALPSYVEKALVSKITVFGKTQLTYKGWPLYSFGADSKRGDTKGVSQPSFGIWPIVNATSTAAVAAVEKVTYANFAGALFQTKCNGCHGSSGTSEARAKWIFSDYNSVKNNSTKINNAVLVTGIMPLGGSLTATEKEKLKKWFDEGMVQ